MNRSLVILPLVALCGWWLGASQAEAQPQRRGFGRTVDVFKFLAKKYDTDNDGEISAKEYDRSDENFAKFDSNKDGVLTAADWSGRTGRTRPSQLRGGSTAPAVGEPAPDFTLTEILDETKEVKLSSFFGSKPVALVFGSCT